MYQEHMQILTAMENRYSSLLLPRFIIISTIFAARSCALSDTGPLMTLLTFQVADHADLTLRLTI